MTLEVVVTTTAVLDEEIAKRQEPNMALRVRDTLNAGPSSFNGSNILNHTLCISQDAWSTVLSSVLRNIPIAQISDYMGQALLSGCTDLVAQYKGDASYSGSTYTLSLGQSSQLDSKRDEVKYIIIVDTST